MARVQARSTLAQRSPAVVIATADRRHAFETAYAASDADLLQSFIVGTGIRANSPLLRRSIPQNLRRRLDRYSFSSELIEPQLCKILLAKVIRRTPGIEGTRLKQAVWLLAERRFDAVASQSPSCRCEIFHSFGGFALGSQAVAKSFGATVLNDVFEIHPSDMSRLAGEEAERYEVMTRRVMSPEQALLDERKILAAQAADVILVGLDGVKRSWVGHGIDPQKVVVIPYGAAPHPIRAGEGSESSGTLARKASFHILHVGLLAWYKGLPRLLEAYESACQPDWRLTIVGREHPPWGPFLRSWIERLPNVTWISHLPPSELGALYATADVFAFPSLVGGLGLVTYEAMAAGAAAVVSDGDAVIVDREHGLVSGIRPESIAAALTELYENPKLKNEISRAGRERASEYGWPRYRRHLQTLYRSLLDERASVAP